MHVSVPPDDDTCAHIPDDSCDEDEGVHDCDGYDDVQRVPPGPYCDVRVVGVHLQILHSVIPIKQ